ncbi:hypothetical protein ACFX13_033212 [Malus domestica]
MRSSKKFIRKVRILTIDPTGTTDGIFTANALSHLESSLRKKFSDPNAAISNLFDVVFESSASGILVALLFTRGLKEGST